MSDTWPPPQPPIKVSISIGAEDWDYVVRALENLAAEAALRDPAHFDMASGGGGGSHHATVMVRDVTPEAYRAELSEWFEKVRSVPA